VLSDLAALDRADPMIGSVEAAVRAAGVELAEAAIAARRPGTAVSRLAAMTAEYPLDELLHAVLIESQVAAGRPIDALRVYDALRERLTDELGARPGHRVHQAYLAALAQDEHATERWAVPAQLPPDITDLTGRNRQIVLIMRMLSASGARAVPAITGMGGVGKSALAVHIAHRLASAFPDGQLYVDLRGTEDLPADPAQVLHAFLVALGVPGRAVPESPAERTALYRSLLADRRVLVLLDNAASERQVRQLLPGSPRSAALVTSRRPLTGLEVVGTVPLPPMETRHAIELLAGIAGAGRIRNEPEAAAEIVRLCENIPLAVRIAGARLADRGHLSLARLAAALRDERRRLDELTVGDLAVRASFMLSYLRLSEPRKRLFRLLGLLRVPDFAAWVGAVLLEVSVEEAEAHLESLADSRLLAVVRVGEDNQPRYGFHDLVRLFAGERAEEEDDTAVRDAAVLRTLGAWLWLAERAADEVPGPCYAPLHGPAVRTPNPGGSPVDAMAWFDAEHRTLVAAVAQACAAGLDEYAWDLAGCLEKFFDVRGLYERWRLMHETAIELCREVGNRRGEAVLLRGLIEVTTWSAGQGGVAMVAMYERSRELLARFEELGDDRGMADACVMSAWGLVAQGETERAIDLAARGLRLAEASGHLGGQARAHHTMALAYGRTRIRPAIAHLNIALDLARRLGNPRFEATVTQFLGVALCEAGESETGWTLLTRALDMSRALRDEYVEAFSLLYLGKLYVAQGDPAAAGTLEAVLRLARRNRLPHYLADALQTAGELDLAEGRVRRAVTRLEDSVEIWRSRGWLAFLADGLAALGEARLAAGDRDGARTSWTEAQEIYGGLGDATAADATAERLGRLDAPSAC
jgi:tetratricopeptide (TPR) repeat protein